MPAAASTDVDAAAIWRSSDVAQAFSLLDEPVMSESDPAESFAGEHVTGTGARFDGQGWVRRDSHGVLRIRCAGRLSAERAAVLDPSSDILEADITGTETHTLDPHSPITRPTRHWQITPLSVAIDPRSARPALSTSTSSCPTSTFMGGD